MNCKRYIGCSPRWPLRRTGVAYHPGHVWKLLRRMGWRLQRPARRAVERDQQAIARWVAEDWP
jgi:transposase